MGAALESHLFGDAQPATMKIYGTLVETRKAEKLCVLLGLTVQQVWAIMIRFSEYTAPETFILQRDIAELMRHSDRYAATLALRVCKLPYKKHMLSFDEFLVFVCTFATMTETELLVIDDSTTVRGFQREVQWNAVHHRLARGL